MPTNTPNIDVSEEGITLQEYRPGKFVIVAEGKTLRVATENEVRRYKYYENSRRLAKSVDGESIVVGLAINAVCAVVAKSDTNVWLSIAAGMCFVFSVFGSAMLFVVFISTKIPQAKYEIDFQRNSLLVLIKLITRWFRFMSGSHNSRNEHVELGYLTLVIRFMFIMLIALLWVASALISRLT